MLATQEPGNVTGHTTRSSYDRGLVKTRRTAEAGLLPTGEDPSMDASPRTNTATALRCDACGAEDDGVRGWRIYLVPFGGYLLETFCPACAECELGEDER